MQTADFGNCNNLTDRLCRTRIRRIFIQLQMETASLIVTEMISIPIEFSGTGAFALDMKMPTLLPVAASQPSFLFVESQAATDR